MNLCLLKINGWPDTFDERVEIIAQNVDHVDLIRPAPVEQDSSINQENVEVYELYPRRGDSIDSLWIHLIAFPIYVLQAIGICSYLSIRKGKSPDVFHALDYVLGGLVVTVVSLLFQTPNVVSVRGLTGPRYEHMAEEDGGRIAQLNYAIVSNIPKIVLPRADAVITKAEYQATYLREELGVAVPIYTIPTGVDFQTFNSKNVTCDSILEDIFGKGETPEELILHLGRLTTDKGLDRLVDLIEKTDRNLPSSLTFLCVGRYRNDEFRSKIETRRARLEERLVIHSTPIPYERVPELFACVDGVVLLSEPAHEGTPRVLQEAYAMNRPFIASDVDGIAEAFKDLPGCFLIDRDDEVAFRDAAEEIVTGSVSMDREKARNRFDICQNYAEYRDIYTKLSLEGGDSNADKDISYNKE